MTELLLSIDSKVSREYCLLLSEKKWIEKIRSAKKACSESSKPACSKKLALIMKGRLELHAHDDEDSGAVRRIEHSSTLLLTSSTSSMPLFSSHQYKNSSKTVLAMLNAMFHLQPTPPIYDALRLLRANYLSSEEMLLGYKKKGGKVYSFSELCLVSDCAPKELITILQEKGAIIHRNKVRLPDEKEIYFCLYNILKMAENYNAVSFSDISEKISSTLASTSPVIVITARYLFEELNAASTQSSYVMSLRPLSTLRGIAGFFFLNSAESKEMIVHGIKVYVLDIQNFIGLWTKEAPSLLFQKCGVNPSTAGEQQLFELLNGFAISNLESRTAWWIPQDFLPYQIEARLSFLFEINPHKWEEKCLQAYMQPLFDNEQNFSHCMQRYSREYRVPGKPVMYSKLSD